MLSPFFQPGLEEHAVFTLFQLVGARVDVLTAAYTRGAFHGSVFIEANINADLRRLLHRTPGIMMKHGEPIVEFVPLDERPTTLRLPKGREMRFKVGQWVRVLWGIYKGDLVYVKALQQWGGVRLLLIPSVWKSSPVQFFVQKKKNLRPRLVKWFLPKAETRTGLVKDWSTSLFSIKNVNQDWFKPV